MIPASVELDVAVVPGPGAGKLFLGRFDALRGVALFERLTEEHDQMGEHVVYPAIDRALRSDAPAELIKQLEELL